MPRDPTQPPEKRKVTEREKRWEWLVWNTDLPAPKRAVLQVLFRWHMRYREVFIGEARLAHHAGMSTRSAQGHLAELEADKWFTRKFCGKGLTGRAYTYTLCFPAWFDATEDRFLLEVARRKLEGRLIFRESEEADNGANWSGNAELEAELERIVEKLKEAP